MSRIFISYSSKSKNLVTSLTEDLETANYQVWFDHKLMGGQSWWDQILENIRQCDIFIFALTPEALSSYPCQLEYKYAYQLNKNILPILVADGVSPDLLPSELSVIQFVDYRRQDKQAALRLMTALNNLPDPHALPDPLPESPTVPISYLGNLKEQIEAEKTLSFEEQSALVLKLKEHLSESDNSEDALSLLRQMKRRDDLLAKIENEIDSVLNNPASSMPLVQSAVDMAGNARSEVEGNVHAIQNTDQSTTPIRILPWEYRVISVIVWAIAFSVYSQDYLDLGRGVPLLAIAFTIQVVAYKLCLRRVIISSLWWRQLIALVGGLFVIWIALYFIIDNNFTDDLVGFDGQRTLWGAVFGLAVAMLTQFLLARSLRWLT